jgi:hypothetical protein
MMDLFASLGNVREAKARMVLARHELRSPSTALLERGRRYPLMALGSVAGAGFVMGQLNVHPLRLPGLGALISGGMSEAIAMGTHLIAELGAAGLAQAHDQAKVSKPAAPPDVADRGKPV